MSITHAKLTLQNERGETLTVEALNPEPDQPTTHRKLGELFIALAEAVGGATASNPGFIDTEAPKNEAAHQAAE